MSERSAAIGLASASSGLPPPNSSACGLAMNDHVTASTRFRAASARLALRVRCWIGVSTGLRGAAPRSNGVGGTRSTPNMRTTSSTMSALPCTSGRHDGTAIFTRSPWPATKKPSRSSTRRISGSGTVMPASRLISDSGKSMMRSVGSALPATAMSDGVPPHRSRTMRGGKLQSGQHECRIDAALETITRVGIDAELAAGLRDVEFVPQRRFDEHVGCGFRAAGLLAAHDAGQRFDAILVGDDADRVVELVGLAVERQQLFAGAAAAHREIAAHFRGVEHVQRPAAVVGHEIGDIDQRIDRAQADRGQPLLQPGRRRAVLDAANEAQCECRAKFGSFDLSRRPGRETRP